MVLTYEKKKDFDAGPFNIDRKGVKGVVLITVYIVENHPYLSNTDWKRFIYSGVDMAYVPGML